MVKEWETVFCQRSREKEDYFSLQLSQVSQDECLCRKSEWHGPDEYLDRFYEETSVSKINEILYDCLIEYNFYQPHRSLNLLTPIEYCSKLNNRDAEMVQMYWTQTYSCILLPIVVKFMFARSIQFYKVINKRKS